MQRRDLLRSLALALVAGATTACGGGPRPRKARRARARRRRRWRRWRRRWRRRKGKRVQVYVVPQEIEVGESVELEEHGECTVQQVEETRVYVKTAAGAELWIEVSREEEEPADDEE